MSKRTIKTSRLLVDDVWCCISYQEDGVLEVQRKEELVPEADQERCGTTLRIGETCTAKYIDNNIYPATVLFESGEKEQCLKFKLAEEKKQQAKKDRKGNEKKESISKKRKTQDVWCCISYQEDGVLEVQRKEELVPEADQERCGTTLRIGETCTAKYIDNNIYPATVLFESDEKEQCLKFKLAEEKKQQAKKDRKGNEKKESISKKRKTQEMSLPKSFESQKSSKNSGDETARKKRKKEIKEEEKKQSLAKERAAQEHAAKLFARMHAKNKKDDACDTVSEPPIKEAIVSKDPSVQAPPIDPNTQTLPIGANTKAPPTDPNSQTPPMDQNTQTLPTDPNTKAPPTDPNSKALPLDTNTQAFRKDPNTGALNNDPNKQAFSKDPNTLAPLNHQNPQTNPQTVIPLDPPTFAHASNTSNFPGSFQQQTPEFDPSSAFTAHHTLPPLYSQMSPFQNAFKQPLLPSPNFTYSFPYNHLPTAPSYPSLDFPSQTFPNFPASHTDWFKSNCNSTSHFTPNHTTNFTSNSTAMSKISTNITGSSQSNFASSSISNFSSTPDSPESTSRDMSSNFSPSGFMSSSMALLDDTNKIDIESMSDDDMETDLEDMHTGSADIEMQTNPLSQSDNSTSTNIEIQDNADLQSTNTKSQCPDCIKKDREIADLKMRLFNAGASTSTGEIISRNRTYKPRTRPEMKLGDYVIVPEKSAPPVGFQLLAPKASVAVKPLWLEEVISSISKERYKRNKKAAKKGKQPKKNTSGEILKKLMDGFFEPEELAIGGGVNAFSGNAIFESLKQYAIHCLSMDIPSFHESWREKMSSSKQTIKRKSNRDQ